MGEAEMGWAQGDLNIHMSQQLETNELFCQLGSSLNRLEVTCSGKKYKLEVCFFWGQKDVNAGVWQWERGRKRG